MITNKHFEGLISSMCGLGGYGAMQVNLHIPDEILKFGISMLTALLAGGVGWLGQQLFKKIFKSKKNNNNDND